MNGVELQAVYDQLKNRCELTLTNAFSLNSGFRVDCPVLFGQTAREKFYLYLDGDLAVFDIENQEGTAADHWHPGDTREAIQNVIDFLEGSCEFDWHPVARP